MIPQGFIPGCQIRLRQSLHSTTTQKKRIIAMRVFTFSLGSRRPKLLFFLFAAIFSASFLRAQVVISGAPVIHSSNTVSADLPVPQPATRSCTVQLFTNLEFADFNTKTFSYTPPANCKGPWSKVVFTANFTVTEGTQYDRTAQFYLGGANIFYGTTAEPRSSLSPSWRVERDVTELTSLLESPQSGTALLGNYVGVYNGVDYDGIIYADAHLTFFEPGPASPAAATPNLVIGVPGGNGAATLNTSTSVYTQTLTLPTNVTSAYLDVFAQGQSNDEFWYFSVPNNLTTLLEDYGNTGFRETEITIDGKPAGVAPVYPWIFTGGIDPFLWEPIPGVQTLDFKPFRVDLTPFAGLLSNGKTHTVGLQVFNANSYFLVAANLLVYTDPILKTVTGELVSNTLPAQPTPVVIDDISTDGSGDAWGAVSIESSRPYAITGYVNSSLGQVQTVVNQDVEFRQTQYFTINSAQYNQFVVQTTTATGGSATTVNGVTTTVDANYSYPFSVNYNAVLNSNGSESVTTQTDQQYTLATTQLLGTDTQYSATDSNNVLAQDTLNFDASGNFTGISGTKSSQTDSYTDSFGACSSETLTSAGEKLNSVVYNAACAK
jgi:hypothetical protein